MKTLTSIRLPELTASQIEALKSKTGLGQSEIITIAIDRMYREEIKIMEPNRKDFAKVVADAYVEQYMGGGCVMGDPVIDYDPETRKFSWTSPLVPECDNVRVFDISEGCFGDGDGATKRQYRSAIVSLLMEHDWDYAWYDVLDKIEQAE